jgi:hypothetical protein
MGKDEVAKLGGPEAIRERGKTFTYTPGAVKSVNPQGWDEMSRVWFVRCHSQDLRRLRESHGLTPLYKGHEFHITFAVKPRDRRAFTKGSAVSPALLRVLIPTLVGAGVGGVTDIARAIARKKHTNVRFRPQSLLSRLRGTLIGGGLGAGLGAGYHAYRSLTGQPRLSDDAMAVIDNRLGAIQANLDTHRQALADKGLELPTDTVLDFYYRNPQVLELPAPELEQVHNRLMEGVWTGVSGTDVPTQDLYRHALEGGVEGMVPREQWGELSQGLENLQHVQRASLPLEAAPAVAAMPPLGQLVAAVRKGGLKALARPGAWRAAGATVLPSATGVAGGLLGQELAGRATRAAGVSPTEDVFKVFGRQVPKESLARLLGFEAGYEGTAGLTRHLRGQALPTARTVTGATVTRAPGSGALQLYLAALAIGGVSEVRKMLKDPRAWRESVAETWTSQAGLAPWKQTVRTLVDPAQFMRQAGTAPTEATESLRRLAETTPTRAADTSMARARADVVGGDMSTGAYMKLVRDMARRMPDETSRQDFVYQHAKNLANRLYGTPQATPRAHGGPLGEALEAGRGQTLRAMHAGSPIPEAAALGTAGTVRELGTTGVDALTRLVQNLGSRGLTSMVSTRE